MNAPIYTISVTYLTTVEAWSADEALDIAGEMVDNGELYRNIEGNDPDLAVTDKEVAQ